VIVKKKRVAGNGGERKVELVVGVKEHRVMDRWKRGGGIGAGRLKGGENKGPSLPPLPRSFCQMEGGKWGFADKDKARKGGGFFSMGGKKCESSARKTVSGGRKKKQPGIKKRRKNSSYLLSAKVGRECDIGWAGKIFQGLIRKENELRSIRRTVEHTSRI